MYVITYMGDCDCDSCDCGICANDCCVSYNNECANNWAFWYLCLHNSAPCCNCCDSKARVPAPVKQQQTYSQIGAHQIKPIRLYDAPFDSESMIRSPLDL